MKNHQKNNFFQQFDTLIDILIWRGANQAQQKAYQFLSDASNEQWLTYAELDLKAKHIGSFLQSIRAPGERVLLFFQPGLDYITAFFGCLYGGMIAVPSYPPKTNSHDLRTSTLINDAGASVVLSTEGILSKLGRMLERQPALKELQWIDTNNIPAGYAEKWHRPDALRGDIAYLQYTSGSTAQPKGVMVSHENIMHNSEMIYQCFGHTDKSCAVDWLPPYHDMGLIGGIIQPVYGGFPSVLMSPFRFLENPLAWLQAISRYKGTSCGGPNFAYELCMQKIPYDQREALDLRSWDVAFNGAEPVRADTMERFSKEFAPYGFRKEAFYPCYGLAEATLLVTNCDKRTFPTVLSVNESKLGMHQIELDYSANGKNIVSSGNAFPGEEVLIVDPESRVPCLANQVGEIWIQSASVTKGYWKKAEETEKTFQAYTADRKFGPYLRTGDLGFLKEDELYVSGRLKDLIIIRGKNHYPQDIEFTVERCHEAMQPGGGAVFSIERDGEERLVAVQEVKRTYRNPDVEEIARKVREAVAENHEIQVYALVLIKVMSLPKTSSGKVQRQLCKKMYLSGELSVIGESVIDSPAEASSKRAENVSTAASESSDEEDFILSALSAISTADDRRKIITMYLKKIAASIIKIKASQLDEKQPLSHFGLDSLMAVELTHKLEKRFGVLIPISQILEGLSISEISDRIEPKLIEINTGRNADGLTDELEFFRQGKTMPLSHGQQALWFLHKLAKNSAAYNLAYAVKIRQAIQPDLLRKAFEIITERHSILLTTFQATNSGLAQIYMPERGFLFEERTAEGLKQEELHAELEGLAVLPFDLENGPLFRIYLLKSKEEEHTLLLVIHHIIADFWSLSILLKELTKIYHLLCDAKPVNLPLPQSSYFDYIKKQSEIMNKPQLEQFWMKNLSGELPILNLATDYRRPAVQTYNGASCTLMLDSVLSDKIRKYSTDRGATVYMTCLAVFSVLLYRYTGQEDICIGSPTAGRNSTIFSDSIGYFVNPVVMRVLMGENPSFNMFLSRVRKTVLNAFEHQDFPFELLVDKLQLKRDLSRSPLFQVMFSYQKAPDAGLPELAAFAFNEIKSEIKLNGFTLELIPLKNQSAQFDLTLTAAEFETGLGLSVQYNKDLFKAESMSRLLDNFKALLEDILVSPESHIAELSLLSSAEKEKILYSLNDTGARYEKACLHRIFEAQASFSGQAPAVICGTEYLTYSELNAKANQLAKYIRQTESNGSGITAIYMERTTKLVIALLAVLKAGGSYLPLDPIYPKERIGFILEDVGKQGYAPLVITQSNLLAGLPEHQGKVICIDEEWTDISTNNSDNLNVADDPEALAYVIYTSGSTGNPKGVMIPHRAVVNFLNSMRKRPGLSPEDILLSVTTISFDIAGLEIFLPLTTGARVVLSSFENTISGNRLAEEITKTGATIMQATPSVYRLLLETGWQGNPKLKVLCGGEAFPRDLAAGLLPKVKEVWNMYGPTETTIWSTIHKVECEEDTTYIGRPIDNTQVYILDTYLQPVPVGVIGELYIGGDGVAHGYFQNPELTKQRFLHNPFRQEAEGSRIYKTGDLCRYLNNGLIEFQGRVDHQIKLHGHRIELGEIEAVLSKYPGINEVLTVLHDDPQMGKRLVAYVIAGVKTNDGDNAMLEPPKVSELRNYLKEKLPEYMIPSFFMFMDTFPKTPNGKIDRKSLPNPGNIRPELDTQFVTPRNELEHLIADIWKAKLKVDKIGIHDNFFDLGGHSVLMAQIYQELNIALPDSELSIVELFQYPSVNSLAQYINKSKEASEVSVLEEERSNIRRQRRNSMQEDRNLRRKARFEKDMD